MKKHLLIAFALICGVFSHSYAQQFWEMIEQGTYSIQEIQKAAEAYFDVHGRGKGSGYKQFKMWEYHALMEANEKGMLTTNNEEEQIMKKFRASLPKTQVLSTTANWSEMGPTKRNPTTSWNPGVGRVECLSVDPNNYNHILVGSPSGGAWKTTDGGTTWAPLSDFSDNMNMVSVTIDPNNSLKYFLGTTSGIYRSTDGGATFTKVYNNNSIKKIMVKPDDSQIIIAATSGGLIRSTNGGTTWSTVSNGGHYDVEFKPGVPNTVYACASGVVKYSTNGGATWTNSSGFSGTECRLAVTAADAAYVYVLNSSAAVYRSTDSGLTFSAMGNTTDIFGGLSWYGMGFAASNNNKNILFGGCFEFYKSTDGGATFNKQISWTWTGNSTTYIHADLHACETFGSFVFTGSDGGIHKGSSEGTSFVDLSTGLGIRQFYCIGLSKSESGKIVGGAQDEGTVVYRTSDNKWYEWLGADGMEAFVDWSDANVLVGTSQNGSIYISTNNGSNYLGKGKPGGIDGNWVTPVEQDPVDATTFYVGNSNLYKGTLPGGNFTLISASPGGNFTQIKVAPTNNNIIYSSTGSNLYKSTNKGVTWTNIYNNISGSINNIAIDPDDENRVAVATTGFAKVYVTTDGGSTWNSKQLNLPSISANCLVYKAGSENGLYVGMSSGVYYIDDNLANWQNYSDNLPYISVKEIEIDETGGYVYIGTYGRGVWKSPIYTAGPAAQKDVQAVSINNATINGCGLSVTPSVTIKNKGTETLNSLTIQVYVNNVLVSTLNPTALNIAKNATTNIALGSLTGIDGANTFKVVLSNVNGGLDEYLSDNEVTSNSTFQDGVAHRFYIDDNSKNNALAWTIKQGATTIKSSSNITPVSASGVTSYDFCLATGCYDINITNAFNSGSCTTPAWSSATTYVGDATLGAGKGEVVSYNGIKYRAQWWTKGDIPGTNSVWLNLGTCVSSSPTDKLGFKNVTANNTYFETTVANYTSPESHQFCNGASLNVDFSASNTNAKNCENITFTANVTNGTGTTYLWNFGAGATPATANTAGPHTVSYSSVGAKDVTLTVDNVQSSKTGYITVVQDLNIVATVDVQLTTGSLPACPNDQLVFTANTTNAGSNPTYKWYNGLNVVQNGSSNVYSTSTYNNSDEIRCELTSNQNCVVSNVVTSNPLTINVDVCTSINEELKKQISIFPNPANSVLNINYEGSEMIQYRIYNSVGQTLTMGTMFGAKKIDFSTYSNGIYYVEIVLGEYKLVQQIVK